MTTKEDIIDYVNNNSVVCNRAVIEDMLEELPTGGITTFSVIIDLNGQTEGVNFPMEFTGCDIDTLKECLANFESIEIECTLKNCGSNRVTVEVPYGYTMTPLEEETTILFFRSLSAIVS